MQRTVSYVSRAIAALALSALAFPHVGAQGVRDSTFLPGVVVTADRLARPLGTTTATVTVITGEQLRSAGIVQLVDALRAVPGVNVVRTGSAGAQTSLFLRGGESDYVRVLVDGVAMNDPGGAIDLSAITVDNVERIEVVRGPASVLYGSDAVTGVVHIFTRQARAQFDTRLAARAGTYATSDVDGAIGLQRSGHALTLALADHRSDGMLPFNNDYRNQTVSLRGNMLLPGKTSLSLTLRNGDNRFAYPTDGSGNVVDRNAHRSERRFATSAELARSFGPRVDAHFSLGALELHGRTSDLTDSQADTVGFYSYRSAGSVRRRTLQAQVNVHAGQRETVTLGLEYAGEAQRSADSSSYDFSLNRFDAHRITRAAFGQLIGETGRLTYSVGGRVDDNDVYGVFRTARAGAALQLWNGARARGSVGSAFKAPTFLESFSTAFSVGNADLRPERSRSWEGALEQRLADGRVELGAVWFDQRFRDLIQYTFRSPTDPNYFNVAAASARGLEANVRVSAARGVDLWTNATLLRTRVDDAGFQAEDGDGATFVRGQRLLRRAPQTLGAGITLSRLTRTQLQFALSRVGRRDDRDFSTFPAKPVELAPYLRADFGGEYQLTSGSSLWRSAAITWRFENLFDARYSEIQGFSAPGRFVLAGFRLGTMR
ncbi:MAG: TonB-dependent receptor [Gemmatimonadaceae bacterium]